MMNNALSVFRVLPIILAALFFVTSTFGVSFAEEARPTDKRSDGEFTGIAMLTDDVRWYEQFSRPEVPNISGISHVGPGQRAAIALLFSNAKARNGIVKVLCTITATEPNGDETSFPTGTCYEGPARPANVLYPSLLDLQFSGGEDDETGVAKFDIALEDAHSKRKVVLTVSFTQGASND